ncbi:MAG: hypothetical protein ACFFCS_25200 [Candidatus Hodarchaeota archaeon]
MFRKNPRERIFRPDEKEQEEKQRILESFPKILLKKNQKTPAEYFPRKKLIMLDHDTIYNGRFRSYLKPQGYSEDPGEMCVQLINHELAHSESPKWINAFLPLDSRLKAIVISLAIYVTIFLLINHLLFKIIFGIAGMIAFIAIIIPFSMGIASEYKAAMKGAHRSVLYYKKMRRRVQ